MSKNIPLIALVLASMLILAGCSRQSMNDLHQYVHKMEARPGPPLKPIPQLEPYQTYTYHDQSLRSPFQAPVKQHKSNNNVRPNAHRNKEYLEQFPLDGLTMVGIIKMNGVRYALIRDVNGLVHRVHAGNYMGQNDGRIVSISKSGLKLREIVPDGLGGYAKRMTKVPLATVSSKNG